MYHEKHASDNQPIVFVCGLMRSGTSLLYRLLNNHPQIALLYEADVFVLRPLLWNSRKPRVWCQRLDFWNGTLGRHGIDAGPAGGLPSRVRGPAGAFIALATAHARPKPGAYIGSKSIHYSTHLPKLARTFPTARFIVLWRPLEGIMDSLDRAGRTNAYLAPVRRRRQVFAQYGQLAEGVLALRRAYHSVHELRFQDLIGEPEGTARNLCEFLALPWSPEMLQNDPGKSLPIPDEPHHFHARHTAVGAATAVKPEISGRLAAKARAYEQYWAARLAGKPVLLALPRTSSASPPPPWFGLVRLADRFSFSAHRALLFAKLIIYRFAPLALLRWYRACFRPAPRSCDYLPRANADSSTVNS